MKCLLNTVLTVAGLVFVVLSPVGAVTLDEVGELIHEAPVVDGTNKHVGQLGDRVVVVTFFASWCPPCRIEFKHLNDLVRRIPPNQVTVIGINQFEAWGGKENPARMTRFLADTKPQFALIKGSERLRLSFGDIERIPTVVVLDKDGQEVWRFVHERGASKTHATGDELMSALAAAGVDIPSQ